MTNRRKKKKRHCSLQSLRKKRGKPPQPLGVTRFPLNTPERMAFFAKVRLLGADVETAYASTIRYEIDTMCPGQSTGNVNPQTGSIMVYGVADTFTFPPNPDGDYDWEKVKTMILAIQSEADAYVIREDEF